MAKKDQKKFFEFFSKYFWFAIFFILVSIILLQWVDPTDCCYRIVVFVSTLLSTLGLTILVASIFTYTLGTEEFIRYIEEKLEGIIIGRNFLSNMDSSKKEEALLSILKPNMSQQKMYSNLDEYYEYYIKDVMDVSKKNVRSDYKLRADIKYDSEKKKLYAEGTAVYRLYPSETGYVPIKVGIDDESLSKCTRLEIYDSVGKINPIKTSELDYSLKLDRMNIAEVSLSEYSIEEHNHLTIEIDFLEYGYDHWMAFTFFIFQPTDGLNVEIRCFDDISLKEKLVFDNSSKYHISVDKNEHYKTSAHQWVQEGSGFVFIASKPEECLTCNT